jgi:hypothetical protein
MCVILRHQSYDTVPSVLRLKLSAIVKALKDLSLVTELEG